MKLDNVKNLPLKMSEFRLFQKLMYDHAGIYLSDRKQALVQNRLRRRIETLGLKSYREYYDCISNPSHKDEFQECLNALTTNETYFFRHKNHWDYLLQIIIPQIKRQRSGAGSVRAWSCASSSGEEPYSIAIALYDSLPPQDGWKVGVDATDINQDVINRARKGVYNEYAVQKLTKLCIQKYFYVEPGVGEYHLHPEVKNLVNFRLHNLLDVTRGPAYDLIFLRNVMIYFDDKSKSAVMRNVTSRLASGGHLFLGGAETLSACNEQYEYVRPTIYRKK